MNSKVSFATTTLSYPIFAADFDPYNRGYLVVGGGGGESRSGVPNQITVLDVYNRAIILTVAEIKLSSGEDSVQSLASLATKEGLITFAGVNSSQADQDAGKNEHFRAFDIKIPARKRLKLDDALNEKGVGTLIGRKSLFKPNSVKRKEAYQRLLRLSPAKRESGTRRIGAIASGMSKPAAVVVFDATTALPGESDIIARIQTSAEDDILDLDIAVADQDRFSVAWCTDYDIYEQTYDYDFSKKSVRKTPSGPRRVYQMSKPESTSDSVGRSKFRCIRFLDSQNILALVNLAGKAGAEFRIYHLYPTGPATTTFQMPLPSHVKQAISMDVCLFDSDAAGNRQIMIAIAGQDISITTWLVDYKAVTDTFSKFYRYQTARDVHKHQMTKICFAPFHRPQPVQSGKQPAEQYAKLASVSYGNSVVVDSFPLFQLKSNDPTSRYVLAKPGTHNRVRNMYIVVLSFVVLIMAFIGQTYATGGIGILSQLQSYLAGLHLGTIQNASTNIAAAGKQMEASILSVVESTKPSDILGERVGEDIASIVESSVPVSIPDAQTLKDLLDLHPEPGKAVIVKADEDAELTINVHHDKAEYLGSNPHAKHWDELHEEQRSFWRQRLQKAGKWAEGEGETVLKGVLWSQWAGLVGDAAGEILREL